MADHSHDFFSHILGLGMLSKAYKSLVSKCHPVKISSPQRSHSKDNQRFVEEAHCKANHDGNHENQGRLNGEKMQGGNRAGTTSTRGFSRSRSVDNHFGGIPYPVSRNKSPSPLSRTSSCYSRFSRSASQTGRAPTPNGRASLLRSISRRRSVDGTHAGGGFPFAINGSRKGSTPIMYSNSHGLIKPPAIEKKLECTLEELCFGCVKKITITRDVATNNGQVVQEEEVLTIKVKPGWRRGTKITFEGMGDETPGSFPADVIFVITEKPHPLFRRDGDDLELTIEIDLVNALTGCTLSIPLIDGGKMSLAIDDIVSPGYEKIVAGEGMAMAKQGQRGNLRVKFLVQFPTELSEEQRSDIASVLKECC